MKIFKITNKNKQYIVSAVDSYTALLKLKDTIILQDVRLSPMTYQKLKELGYDHSTWKNLTQEEANKIVAEGKHINSAKSSKQEQPKARLTRKMS